MKAIDIGICSVTATPDKEQNVKQAVQLVREAAERGASWVFLPEMFSYHGPYDQLWDHAEAEDGPLNQSLAQLAKELKIVLFAGSVPERPMVQGPRGKVFNSQYVFGRDGRTLAKYRKIHLFNLKDASGKPLYCESDGYAAGSESVVIEVDGWKVGLVTCYDLRFSGQFLKMMKQGPVDLICAPAAFTLQTGMYHWHLLCRSRAIESLAYVVAANQVGTHQPGKASFGHGVCVDPWGHVVADTGPKPQVAMARISLDTVAGYRGQLPVLENQRPDLYS
jgi:deaminated glutathione amidase